MNAPVDVFAVMDGDIEGMQQSLHLARGQQRSDLIAGIEQMREARAAVAELIEAGRELQAGMDENDTRTMDAGPAKRFLAADARHRAALARIGGAA